MNRIDRLALWTATGFGVGRIPFAPGTWGTVAGLPLCWLAARFSPAAAVVLLAAVVALAVWAAHRAEILMQRRDPGSIVVDEMAGILVTLLGLPLSWSTLGAGFVLFRLFDIVKPFPIRQIERRVSGGFGIVIDDLVAGLFSNLVLRLILVWIG